MSSSQTPDLKKLFAAFQDSENAFFRASSESFLSHDENEILFSALIPLILGINDAVLLLGKSEITSEHIDNIETTLLASASRFNRLKNKLVRRKE